MKSSEQRIQTTCLIILSLIAAAFALYWLRPMLVPFVLALFFHLMFKSAVDLQREYLKISGRIAVVSTVAVSLLTVILTGLLVSSTASQMIANATLYQSKLKDLVASAPLEFLASHWEMDIRQATEPVIENVSNQIGGMIGETINAILNLLSQGLIVFIFFLFLVIGSAKKRPSASAVWRKSEEKIKSYIVSKFITSAVQGMLVGGMLSILGIDLALMFGFFAFVLNFIPTIGPVAAAFLPLPIVLVTPEISLIKGILAVALPGVIMFVIGNFIEPKVVGDTLRLHPVTILMALIFWGMLWGVTGMFLAVPLTAVLTLIFEEIEITKPVADLLAGGSEEDVKKNRK